MQFVCANERSVWIASTTINLPKVKKLLSEQKELESSAKESESLVCQVKQTLDL